MTIPAMAKRATRRQLSFTRKDSDHPVCVLCHGHHCHKSSPADWKSEEARKYVLSLDCVAPESPVCRLCRDDVTRALANSHYIPRWRKYKTQGSRCCVMECTNSAVSSVSTTTEVMQVFACAGLTCINDMEPSPLCKQHYQLVYDALQPRQCTTWGTRLRAGNHRSCPQPEIVRKHLHERTGFLGEIQVHDPVCLVCYRSHLVLLRDNSPISTDSDLARLICEYVHNIPTIAKVLTTQDVIDVSIMKTVVSVGNILLENRAILLPSIHETFMGHVTDTSRVADISLEDTKDVSSRYVLSSLTASLQHHITYSCKVRKYGTLVHRPNADLVPLLSEALWKLRMTQSHQQEKPPVSGSTTPPHKFYGRLEPTKYSCTKPNIIFPIKRLFSF